MGKTLKQKMTRAIFAVTFSGETADPVSRLKSIHVGTKKNKF
jgi:hypothetical protein